MFLKVKVLAGDAGPRQEYYSHITTEAAATAPSYVDAEGWVLTYPTHADDHEANVQHALCETAQYKFKMTTKDKTIKHTLKTRPGQGLMSAPAAAPPPGLAPAKSWPGGGSGQGGIGPPPSPRVLAIYNKNGNPQSGVPFTAGAESGYTDSQGRVIVTAQGDVPLVIENHDINLIEPDNVHTINVWTGGGPPP